MTHSIRLARWWLFASILGGLALFASFSHAATLSCAVGNKTASLTITAGSATRMQVWATAVYAIGADGQPSPDPVVAALMGALIGLENNTLSWESQQAHAAVPPPTPLN